ncbi:MAG: leucine-rich repeat domain-containing protein [Alistipes sp.]|nr:leucine-rich repeat domain-containing protein [Alistipes sp.]
MVVFTDNFEGTEVVRKSLMFIPLDNGEMVSMYAGYDENGSPQYLSFDDIVILIDNYTDTTFNATVVKGNQALWTATNLPLDNFQLDDENNTRAWHENNWVRNTVAIAGIVTSSIGVGIGVALTGTGVGAVAGIASIGFASASLAHNLNVLFGPGESYATNNYIIEKLQEIGQESLVDALAKDSDSYLAKIFKDSEWFDQNYKLPNLFWADLALGLVDKIWGKTVTESQRMQAYALAQRSYSVTTRGVHSLTLHTAELGGYISPEAISPLDQYADVDYGIVVYKADDPSVRQSKLDIIGNGGPFTLLFRGLEANTTYCYFVFYNDKTNYCFRQGETKTFYTEESDLREQLIQFYHSTGGDNWTRNYNWCSDRPLEEWYGISSWDNSLYYIDLDDNNLTGYGALHSSEIEMLDCSNNKLTSLDVSGCTELEELYCGSNKLTSLDVSECTALYKLDCYDNLLTSLDVSRLTELEELFCYNNKLTSLNVSECTALVVLLCYKNNLTSLNVSGLRALDTVDCSDNDQLMSLDVSGCISLGRTWGSITCNSMNLTTLNASGCTSLRHLHIGGSKLTSVDISGCTALVELYCNENKLTSLDVSTCTALEELNCRDNQLTSLDVSSCTALERLDCSNNKFTSLDVSTCTELWDLDCSYNKLTSLNVSKCTALTSLSCYDNLLTSLDVSRLTELKHLFCGCNQLTSLDVSNCTVLWVLDCEDNQLTSLDVSRCTELYSLYCRNNKISQVIPKAFEKLSTFWYDRRYTNYYRDQYGVLYYKDKGVGWWYPGEPQKGYHGR